MPGNRVAPDFAWADGRAQVHGRPGAGAAQQQLHLTGPDRVDSHTKCAHARQYRSGYRQPYGIGFGGRTGANTNADLRNRRFARESSQRPGRSAHRVGALQQVHERVHALGHHPVADPGAKLLDAVASYTRAI